jgi:hypothetical protein
VIFFNHRNSIIFSLHTFSAQKQQQLFFAFGQLSMVVYVTTLQFISLRVIFYQRKILSLQKVGHTQIHNLHRVVFEGKLEKVVETNKVTV